MKNFEDIFDTLPSGSSTKWRHYFKIYDYFFNNLRDKKINFLEIGVQKGGSLKMWREYFKNAKIYGIDIDSSCKKFNNKYAHIFIGDQSNPDFLNETAKIIGGLDIIVDDGSHVMQDQITSLKTLFPYLTENGIYLIEDLHTSYLQGYSGSYKGENTCLEFLKDLIDSINRHLSPKPDRNYFIENLLSVHFYENVAVLIKGKRSSPKQVTSGEN